MANAAKEAAKLKAAQQELQDLQESQEVTNARASQQYDELILKSRNRTLTEEERISFLKKAEKIENDNFKQRSVIVATERAQAIEAAKIAGSLSDEQVKKLEEKGLAYANYLRNSGIITDEEVNNLKNAELAKIAIDAENTRRLEKNQNAQDKLAEDATKKREKEIQDEQSAAQKRKEIADKNTELLLNKSKEEIDLFIAQQGFKKKSREEELAFNNSLAEKELKDLELQYQKGKISKTKYETDKLNITNEALQKNTSIVIENAQLELDAEIENLNKKNILSKIYDFATTVTGRPNSKSEQDKEIDSFKFITRYTYDGNSSASSDREFCVKMMRASENGRVYRKEDLENVDTKIVNPGFGHNGQSYNCFLYKGGPRCHHKFTRKTFVNMEGVKIDVNNPNAKTISVAKAEKYGYRVRNPKEVAMMPNDMPLKGFHPNNKNLPKDVK